MPTLRIAPGAMSPQPSAMRAAREPSAISRQPSARVAFGSVLARVALATLLVAAPGRAQQPMTLQQAIELAQKQGLQAKAVLSTRDAARWRDRAFSARFMPQLSLTGTLPSYLNAIEPVIQPDGSTRFVPRRAAPYAAPGR